MAVAAVERCLRSGRPAAGLLSELGSRLSFRDRSLARRLVTLELRWLLRLDHVIVEASGRELDHIDPVLLGPLRTGIVQLLFLERVPPHAAVSTSVELAAARSRAGSRFVNAVLRKVSAAGALDAFPVATSDPRQRLAVETSHSRFLVDRWCDRLGDERAARSLASNNRDRRASFLVVDGAARRDAVIEELARDGVTARRARISPIGVLIERGDATTTSSYRRGRIYPQDEASQCAALVPPPDAGETVLDAAAAPGGKTLGLLAWEPAVRIVAADGAVGRLPRLLANRRRCGADFAVVASDARGPALGSTFDRVLADLPCSGSGILHKHPELKWRIGAGEIERLASEARAMLEGVVTLVRPGGLLIVSTCSVEPEENEEQVEALLARHPDLELVDLGECLPAGLETAVEDRGRWRLHPADEHDGFTVHVLRRAER